MSEFRHGKAYVDHREDPRVRERKTADSAAKPGLYLDDGDVRLWHGDALQVLRELPDESVHMCVTSPPFYGLRDYGTGRWEGGNPDCDHEREAPRSKFRDPKPGATSGRRKLDAQLAADAPSRECKCGARRVDQQIGLEETPEQWVANLVAVFREVKRVLRDDGTLWLEIGDSYNAHPGGAGGRSMNALQGDGDGQPQYVKGYGLGRVKGLKPKDLIGAPWMLAFALRADGWYLRSDIVWARPNPMPESVTDRPTKSHSYIFLLAKQPRYFFDQEAVREPHDSRPQQRLTANVDMPLGAARVAAGVQQGNPQGGAHISRFAVECGCAEAGCGRAFDVADCGCACHGVLSEGELRNGTSVVPSAPLSERAAGRNVRSVWNIATQPYPEAHFATFPEELARRCILAGTSERGCCPECGAPWIRQTELTPEYRALLDSGKAWQTDEGKPDSFTNRQPKDHPANVPPKFNTTGWRHSCECYPVGRAGYLTKPRSVPCVVLDPFVGSGTVPYVARKHGRHSIGIDLSQSYLELAARRLQQLSLFA